MRFAKTGLKFTIFISLFCHIFCFSSVKLTFGKRIDAEDSYNFYNVFFLGPIFTKSDYTRDSIKRSNFASGTSRVVFLCRTNALGTLSKAQGLTQVPQPYLIHLSKSEFNKPSLPNLRDDKILYLEPSPTLKLKKGESSIMFYPSMPYHFLLYFKDRQTAHMEVAFCISPKGRIDVIKRKISSGNPEVDLLIMRNLTHFLNLCKANFTSGSSRVVKIDLTP